MSASAAGLFVPSFICVLLLIVHSYIFRGKQITLFFFVSCYIIKVLKCLADSRSPNPDYFPMMDFLNYKSIPYGSFLFTIPVGWIFAHYISWCTAEAVLKNSPKRHNAFFPIIALSTLGTALIGLCMEKVNQVAQWWVWGTHVRTSWLQYFVVWATWSIMFYYFFFMFYIESSYKRILRVGAFVYVILFFVSSFLYNLFPHQIRLLYVFLIFAHIPLFFVSFVKLQPMRRENSGTWQLTGVVRKRLFGRTFSLNRYGVTRFVKRSVIKLLEYWPFVAIFVMIAVCVIGIYTRMPYLKKVLIYCIPIGLWALWGAIKTVLYRTRRG